MKNNEKITSSFVKDLKVIFGIELVPETQVKTC